ncbi:MAG TPA: energy transducer TonB [Candidatus Acidoferrum sp.]|nr:energy transducer TonB [Candidatus Acidoferrum sp.]
MSDVTAQRPFFRHRRAAVLCVVLYCLVAANSRAQQSDNNAVATTSETVGYPETPDGLKHFIEEGLPSSERAGTPSDDYLARLEIPSHASWFSQVFGPAEGARLEAKYQELVPRMPDEMRRYLQFVLPFQRVEVDTTEPMQFDPLITAASAAMKGPVEIYGAKVIASHPKDPAAPLRAKAEWLSGFVYVNGGYRYLSRGVLAALSSAPDLHLHSGGNINQPAVVHRVEPVYPVAAERAHVQGTVTLRVVIAKDGSPRLISLVSGDSLLVDAAVDAVQQWKYQQSRLNNIPIEVESITTVNFSLK